MHADEVSVHCDEREFSTYKVAGEAEYFVLNLCLMGHRTRGELRSRRVDTPTASNLRWRRVDPPSWHRIRGEQRPRRVDPPGIDFKANKGRSSTWRRIRSNEGRGGGGVPPLPGVEFEGNGGESIPPSGVELELNRGGGLLASNSGETRVEEGTISLLVVEIERRDDLPPVTSKSM